MSWPAKADVVANRCGIVGIGTALFLARKGLGVAPCETGRLSHEAPGGVIDVTPDDAPVISRSTPCRASSWGWGSGHGFGIGPGAAG